MGLGMITWGENNLRRSNFLKLLSRRRGSAAAL